MKKILAIFLLSAVALTGCESYLDRQPDDQLTSDSIWEKRATTLQYLYNVYSWTPDDSDPTGQTMSNHLVADELSCAYDGRCYENIIHGSYAPLTSGSIRTYHYNNIYIGIREATYFMENVDRCPELNADDIAMYKAEARFLRAFFYFRLLRDYGPVIWLGDTMADFTSVDLKNADRTPWQTIVDWVCNECDLAAADLPNSDLWGEAWQGRATAGAAMAVKARLLLYSARPLFNGQNGTHIYDELRNKDTGEQLFNTTYDESRWKLAADAAKAIIDLGEYSLVGADASGEVTEQADFDTAMGNLQNLFVQQLANDELIYTEQKGGQTWRQSMVPAAIVDGATSYGGTAPTQKLVDAFACANGYYPIPTDYFDTEAYAQGANVPASVIDSRSGYTEEGYTSMAHPLFRTVLDPDGSGKVSARNTMNMYVGREPRFYRNINWSNTEWACNTARGDVHYYAGGKCGPETSHNYSPTGYGGLKFIDPRQNHKDGWNNISWPVFRLGGVYLDYIEALNEYDPTNTDIQKYWDMLRFRSGVPSIFELYPEIKGNKELQRKYIQRERMVELCMEQNRYYDTRTWMIADVSDDGYVVGCNLKARTDDMESAYWERVPIGDATYGYGEGTVIGPRVFETKNYLLCISQEEVDRVPNITQNLGY